MSVNTFLKKVKLSQIVLEELLYKSVNIVNNNKSEITVADEKKETQTSAQI